MELTFYDRINASLYAMAAGDAMGTGVFKVGRKKIAKNYPHGLTTFVAPDKKNFLFGMKAGEVTGGMSQGITSY